METANRTTINNPFNGDDVVYLHSARAVGVDGEQRRLIDPLRRAAFNVLSAKVKPSGVVGVGKPTMPAGRVDFSFSRIVCSLFLAGNLFPVSWISGVSIASPSLLVSPVPVFVPAGAGAIVRESTRLALVADSGELPIKLGTQFKHSAHFANLGIEKFGTGLHNSDIIALVGDVKPRELREHPERAIRSQAAQECAEGSETRAWSPERTVKPHECAAAKEIFADEIVRPAQSNVQKRGIKSLRDNNVTTIQNRSGVLADNVTNNNALLRKLKAKGNVKPFGGGNVILQEIMYTDASSINANSYSGYEALNIGVNSPISAAQFSITQYAAAVTMSGLEMLQNASKEAIIDLMEGRISLTESQLQNRIDYDLYQDGTGNGGKNLTGLAAAVPDDPTTGTYGGINRANYTFWRSQYYRGVTDGGAAVSAANIQQYMTTLGLRCVRGSDMPDLWVADNTYYGLYVNSLQAIQRISSESGSGTAGAGFPSLKFYGGGMAADVVLGGGISGAVSPTQSTSGATSAHMWALNTNYLFFRPHRDRNFVPIGGERQSVNQDAIVKLIGWAGNLCSSGPQFCGVLIA